jgi:hypothetical protein
MPFLLPCKQSTCQPRLTSVHGLVSVPTVPEVTPFPISPFICGDCPRNVSAQVDSSYICSISHSDHPFFVLSSNSNKKIFFYNPSNLPYIWIEYSSTLNILLIDLSCGYLSLRNCVLAKRCTYINPNQLRKKRAEEKSITSQRIACIEFSCGFRLDTETCAIQVKYRLPKNF